LLFLGSVSHALILNGRVVIDQTPVPIVGASVSILAVSPNVAQKTAADGSFVFDLEEGQYDLRVKANNYLVTQNQILVTRNMDITIGLQLKTAITAPNQRVVAARVQDSISFHNVEESAIVRLSQATLNPDLMNAIKLLPGVASRGSFDARVYVRGGSSYEVIGVLDNIPIYEPYMWGGSVSIFNPNITKRVAFYPGGYHAKGGQSLSGILDVRTKDGNFQKSYTEIDTSLLESNIYHTRPLIKDKSTMMISYRRTYYDLFLPLFISSNTGRIQFPYLQAFQTKYTHKISDSQMAKMGIYYFNDGLNIPFNEEGIAKNEPEGYFKYDQKQFISSLSHTMAVSKKLVNEINVAYFTRRGRFDVEVYADSINNFYQQYNDSFIFRDDISWDIRDSHHLETGLMFYNVHVDDSLFFTIEPDPEKDGSVTANVSGNFREPARLFGGYLQDTWILTDWLSLRYGLRFEGAKFGDYAWNKRIDPRLQLKMKLSEDTEFKVYYGTYSQQLFKANSVITSDDDETLLLAYQAANISMEYAEHLGIGFEHYLSPFLILKGEIFKKNYFDLSIAKESLQETIYYNGGKGFSEGIELLLQQLSSHNFEGWATYTYSRTRRRDEQGWYSPEFDLTHMLKVYGDYEFKSKSHIVATFKANTGSLYTPIISVADSEDTGALVYNQGDRLSKRMTRYIQLDLWYQYDGVMLWLPIPFFPAKNKFLWVFPAWYLNGSTRVGLSNVFNRKNSLRYFWDEDDDKEEFVNDLPLFIIFGYKIIF
tara:strand:- start:81 stop:2375 length:2295 start_codon:yes stop_codon:yes gene_type:complete